jgi:hypothetical protein
MHTADARPSQIYIHAPCTRRTLARANTYTLMHVHTHAYVRILHPRKQVHTHARIRVPRTHAHASHAPMHFRTLALTLATLAHPIDAHVPVHAKARARARTHTHTHTHRHRFGPAREAFLRSAELAPSFGRAHEGAGAVLFGDGEEVNDSDNDSERARSMTGMNSRRVARIFTRIVSEY